MSASEVTRAPALGLDAVADYATVIVAAPDMQGRLFGKRMAPETFVRALENGVNFSSCVYGWDVEQSPGIVADYTGFHTGWHDIALRPDLATLRPAAWMGPDVAICLADAVEVDGGAPVPISPREILRGQVERLTALGCRPVVASELEFFLFRDGYDGARAAAYRGLDPTTAYRSDYAIEQSNHYEPFLRELRGGLVAAGVPVGLAQSEWGHGQWEVNLEHGDPLEIAEAHMLLKLAVKDVARRHGLAATFMAWPVETEEVGSSCHLHCSLAGAGGEPLLHDASAPDGVSETLRHAIGGVLANAADFMAWYAPTVNSYRRTTRPSFAGGGLTWGHDNRTVSCRTLAETPSSARLEWRVPGADVNPYLALSALLASIADGVASRTEPPAATVGNAYEQDVVPLPADLSRAAELLRGSAVARAALGDLVVDHYAAVAAFEWEQFMGGLTDWELRRYFERI